MAEPPQSIDFDAFDYIGLISLSSQLFCIEKVENTRKLGIDNFDLKPKNDFEYI